MVRDEEKQLIRQCVEALREGGLDGNVSVKRLLGHVDREMRRLHEAGEPAYAAAPPIEKPRMTRRLRSMG